MHYELTYIIPSTFEESEIPKLQEKVRGIVTSAHASVVEEIALGKRKLAYPIKQVRHGHYVSATVDVDPSAVGALHRELELAPEVLRHLLTKKRIVSPEQRAREEALRERLMARQAERERKAAEAERAKEAPPVPPEPPAPKLSKEEIDQKIEKLLEEDIET